MNRARLTHTLGVCRALFARPGWRRLILLVGLAYWLVFLVSIQNLTLPGGAWQWTFGDPGNLFRRSGTWLFEPIARWQTLWFTWLISPPNALFGALLALLVGWNAALSVLAWRQPSVCSAGGRWAWLSGIPGLLAGGACCAPALILLLGIQATGLMLTTVQWLLPIAFLLLIGTLVLVGSRISHVPPASPSAAG